MTILVSVEPETGFVRRYDSTVPHGLTHSGRLLHMGAGVDRSIESFRSTPCASLRFDPEFEEDVPCSAA